MVYSVSLDFHNNSFILISSTYAARFTSNAFCFEIMLGLVSMCHINVSENSVFSGLNLQLSGSSQIFESALEKLQVYLGPRELCT